MLKREDFTEERIEIIVNEAKRHGNFDVLSPQQRDENRLGFLKQFQRNQDLWVFGYGSLIWNPAFEYKESCLARVFGFHRRFCLDLTIGRGSPEKPGLMLALDRGGSCIGLAFRIDKDGIESETKVLWMREMISGAYQPQKIKLHMNQKTLEGFTFVINRDHSRYRGQLSFSETVNGLLRGEGILGTCRDYLSNTIHCMNDLGIKEPYLERLQNEILKRKRLS